MKVYNLGYMGNNICRLFLYYDFNTGTMLFDKTKIRSLEGLEDLPNKVMNKILALQMKVETVGVEVNYTFGNERGICIAECFDGKCELWISKDCYNAWTVYFTLIDGTREDYQIADREYNQFLICSGTDEKVVAHMDISPCIAYMLYSDEKFLEDFMQFVYKYETLEEVA